MTTTAQDVVVVSQPTTGGVAVYVRQLVEAAVDDGRKVVVGCPAEGHLPNWVSSTRATWIELPLTRTPSTHDASTLLRLRALMRGAELVHLHSSMAGALGRAAWASVPRSRRPGLIFTPHGWSWLVGGRAGPLFRAVERGMARTADAVVAVSADEAEAGRVALGPRALRQLVVIPNGVDLDRFGPTGSVASRPSQPLVVCVGRLARQKGQDLLIRALAVMRHLDTRVRLVGPGLPADREALMALAVEMGVSDRVEFVGEVDDPAPELRAADIVCQPSRWEGLSLTLLEAMACGAAVVATSVSGTGVLRGGAGQLVPRDDIWALASALDDLLDDPARRDELGHQARRRVVAEADLRQTMQQNLQLWDEVVMRRRR